MLSWCLLTVARQLNAVSRRCPSSGVVLHSTSSSSWIPQARPPRRRSECRRGRRTAGAAAAAACEAEACGLASASATRLQLWLRRRGGSTMLWPWIRDWMTRRNLLADAGTGYSNQEQTGENGTGTSRTGMEPRIYKECHWIRIGPDPEPDRINMQEIWQICRKYAENT